MRATLFALSVVLTAAPAFGQDRDGEAPRVPIDDPTGGAYTPPSPIFTPAAALPTLNVRARAGVEVQPAGGYNAARPLLDVEFGLGRGFTLAAGTTWVGGTPTFDASTLSAYGQVRWQFFGRPDGLGFIGGTALAFKANGYRGGEPEAELSVSLQYRLRRAEFGFQGVLGQGLEEFGERDLEARLYAAWRPIPSLALGASTQLRGELGDEEEEAAREALCRATPGSPACGADVDLIAGGIASFTYERWQVGALVGASSIGLARVDQFTMGFYSSVTGSVRF